MKIVAICMHIRKIFLLVVVVIFTPACEKESVDNSKSEVADKRFYHVTAQLTVDEVKSNYIVSTASLDTGSVSFLRNGYEAQASSTRGTLLFSSSSNNYVYAVDYHGGGKIDQYIVNEYGKYELGETFNYQVVLGDGSARGRVLDENTFAIYTTTNKEVTIEGVTKKQNIFALALLNLPELTIRKAVKDTFFLDDAIYEEFPLAYCMRIDVPCISGNKLYFGMHNETGNNNVKRARGLRTFSYDYPSLENPKIIKATRTDYSGRTNCNFLNSMQEDENGDVYQLVRYDHNFPTWEQTDAQALFFKIKDGIYDESWVFDVVEATGKRLEAMYWQYIKDGIGYMFAIDLDAEDAEEVNKYTMVRVDLHNKTAVVMNVPLSSSEYRANTAVIKGDKYYFPLSVNGGEAAVYAFDVNSDSPDAFTKSLELDKGISLSINGLF